MNKPIRRVIGRCIGISISATLAAMGIVALRHALETPQPQQSTLPGEALLYRWRGYSIFSKVLGNKDAPPLVLLHSPDVGASAHEMQQIMAPLAQTHCVYALDLLGFGLSDRPRIDYSAELYSELCQDFLHTVVGQPAMLVATGLSCNYAVDVAARTPELCASLVLISPITLFGDRQRLPLLCELAEQPLVKALVYPVLCTHLAFRLAHAREQAIGQNDFAQFHATTHQLGAEHAAMALLAGKLTEDSRQAFEGLQQPILMIWGTQAMEDQRNVVSLRNMQPQHRDVELIQDTGLLVHEEQPASVVAAIMRWQKEISAPKKRPTTNTHKELDDTSLEVVPVEFIDTTVVEISDVKLEERADVPPEKPATLHPATIHPAPQGYCVRCKKKREILNAHEVKMKNGRLAIRGTCAVCGINISRIGGLQ